MAKTLEELLADSATGDDVEITLGDLKFNVGALRTMKKAQDAANSAKSDYDKQSATLREKQAAADKLAHDALVLFEAANKIKAGQGGEPAKPADGVDWDNDPVYSPIGKRLRKIEDESLKQINDTLAAIQKQFGTAVNFAVDQYYRQRWDRIPEKDRPKDKSYRDYVKMAQDLSLLDEYKLPDPVMAWERSTAEERRTREIETARKAGIEEGRKAAAAATMPRPGSTPTLRSPEAQPKYKNFNEAMEAARRDPDIMRLLEGEPVA